MAFLMDLQYFFIEKSHGDNKEIERQRTPNTKENKYYGYFVHFAFDIFFVLIFHAMLLA